LDGSIPTGIGNPIEGFKISFDPLLKPVKVFLLILISFGNTGKVKGEVFFL
jgi:hypothetical protein